MKILLLVAEHGFAFLVQAQALAKGLTDLGISIKLIKITNSKLPIKAIEKFNPDIVIGIGSWEEYPFFVEQPQSLGFKTIPWIVAEYPINRFINEYNQLSLILTPSEHCRKNLIQSGIKPQIINILPEAVDNTFWKPISQKEKKLFTELLSLKIPGLDLPPKFDFAKLHEANVPILFTMGGDATSKGAQEVIKALGKMDIKTKEKPWIYLIKTWPSTASFKLSIQEFKLIKESGISEKIHYLSGQFSDIFIRGLTNLCDIYVSPSRKEGFGLPLVQAQLCEKPVISTRATSTAEVVAHGKTGLLVKGIAVGKQYYADINELSKTLESLLLNKELREKLGKQGRKYAIANFSPEIIAEKLINQIKLQ